MPGKTTNLFDRTKVSKMNTLTIAKQRLAVALACDSESDSWSDRYALGNVQVGRANDQAWLAATDGRQLMVAQWADEGDDFTALIPGKLFVIASRECDGSEIILEIAKSDVSLMLGDVKLSAKINRAGKFPTWREIFAEAMKADKSTIRIDTKYLRAAAALCYGDADRVLLRIPPHAPGIETPRGESTIVVSNDSGDTAVIMPLISCKE